MNYDVCQFCGAPIYDDDDDCCRSCGADWYSATGNESCLPLRSCKECVEYERNCPNVSETEVHCYHFIAKKK